MIGVNAQIESESGGNEGVGFAIPSNTVKSIVEQIVEDGSVQHAYLGVSVGQPTGTAGATVDEVRTDTPADAAGLEVGDVVTAVDGQAISSAAGAADGDRLAQAGRPRHRGLSPERREAQVTVTLGTRPS